MEQAILKVSANTDPKKLGGAIAKYLEEGKYVVVKAMGDKPVNNAVKGIIVSRGYLASSAKDVRISPGFEMQETDTKAEVTITVFNLQLVNS